MTLSCSSFDLKPTLGDLRVSPCLSQGRPPELLAFGSVCIRAVIIEEEAAHVEFVLHGA